MKKSDIKQLVKDAINPRKICRVYLKYDAYYRYCFPIITSEKLFLGANEDDFILDGFTIRRFTDVVKAEIKDDKCLEIATAEGIVDSIVVPDVDVSDWHSVFISLQKMNINIIVEKENIDVKESLFAIGRIIKITKTKVVMQHFDADGIWEEEFYEIPFSGITSVSFGTRYVDVFSKYV